jgi:hypothetical protein
LKVAGIAAVFLALWALTPPDGVSVCLFRWLTGLECPLCGLTRGLCAFAKGHWAQAVHFNALTPLAFTMLFALFWRGRWTARLWSTGIAAFLVYGVWRVV